MKCAPRVPLPAVAVDSCSSSEQPVRPLATFVSAAGSKFVQTKWEAKDKKKYEEGKLVKSRNEPCCIVQVCCAGVPSYA